MQAKIQTISCLSIKMNQRKYFNPIDYQSRYHSGDLTFGHYTARIKLAGKWYDFNDDAVPREETEEPGSDNAYLLFYEKQ